MEEEDTMNYFSGEFQHSIDSKGRVIVPAKLRESLGESFTVTVGYDGCLSMYPDEEWNQFVEKLKGLPQLKKDVRKFTRPLLAAATVCEIDKQGRVLIPAKLREYAGFEKDIVFVGQLNKVEIWSKEKWDSNNDYDDMDSIAESMQDMGITF